MPKKGLILEEDGEKAIGGEMRRLPTTEAALLTHAGESDHMGTEKTETGR